MALPVLRKLYRKCRIEEINPEWLANFSVSEYEPMQALLAQDDFTFLSRQPGFDLSLHRKLRRDRLHIFRQYMGRLITDFNKLHFYTRMQIAHSAQDHSELLQRLIWLKIRFSVTVIRTQVNYLLCCLGLRSLAVRALLAQLAEMHAQVNTVAAIGAA